jgi:hypothetical protein
MSSMLYVQLIYKESKMKGNKKAPMPMKGKEVPMKGKAKPMKKY